MSSILHAIILSLVASALVARPLPSTRRASLLAGAMVACPLVGVVLPGNIDAFCFGKEGLLEAFTEGGLLAAIVLGTRSRAWWLVIPACILFLEEIDYGQLFLQFQTPAWLASLPDNRSTQVNFHNLPVTDALFRLVPLLGLFLLSWTQRGFARFGAHGAALAIALSVVVIPFRGHRIWDEAIEFALVGVVLVSMRCSPATATSQDSPPRDG